LTPFNEQLVNIEVINQDRINEIREQLNIQYQTLSSKEKASILAKSIHRMIDQSLPNFSKETKKRIRMELMSKKLSANSLSISANDIIESSVVMATREELEKELPQWVYNKVDYDSKLAELNIVDLLNSYQRTNSENMAFANQSIISINEIEPALKKNILQRYRGLLFGVTAIILLSFLIIVFVGYEKHKLPDQAKGQTAENRVSAANERMPNDLPSYLQYEQIDDKKLREWLNGRNSILAEEHYFSAIIEAASDFNIHPLLLFAITGQEQGFVSRDHLNAEKIANNPFNVYHSWEDFNTNISESSRIAARTIVNVSEDRPETADPIQWINRKYAEDANWWVGVSSIYKQLDAVVQ
jgi:putative ABC transport system permease protein